MHAAHDNLIDKLSSPAWSLCRCRQCRVYAGSRAVACGIAAANTTRTIFEIALTAVLLAILVPHGARVVRAPPSSVPTSCMAWPACSPRQRSTSQCRCRAVLTVLATHNALLTIALHPTLDLPTAVLRAVLAVLGWLMRELPRVLIHEWGC